MTQVAADPWSYASWMMNHYRDPFAFYPGWQQPELPGNPVNPFHEERMRDHQVFLENHMRLNQQEAAIAQRQRQQQPQLASTQHRPASLLDLDLVGSYVYVQ